ncbi:hypothetical protein ALC53_04224 [Atta colombica]|uniref:Uncharacterized protein n=1 Tax=Atta colombica TaxID=520822 RepID=A0A151I559_9HYME|nr:hypothetical protein ALC53_04224 [Atta colombica]
MHQLLQDECIDTIVVNWRRETNNDVTALLEGKNEEIGKNAIREERGKNIITDELSTVLYVQLNHRDQWIMTRGRGGGERRREKQLEAANRNRVRKRSEQSLTLPAEYRSHSHVRSRISCIYFKHQVVTYDSVCNRKTRRDVNEKFSSSSSSVSNGWLAFRSPSCSLTTHTEKWFSPREL